MRTIMHDKDQEGAQKQSTANVIRLTAVRCIYIIAVMILEWILEPVPFQITSFFPLIMGPLLNLAVTRDLAKFYLNEPIANSIAGLTVTLIAQNCGLNKRISYNMILLVGAQIKWLMLTFMTLVFLLSMFISNVAVTSITMSVVDTLIFEISTTELDIRKNELRQQRDTEEEEEQEVEDVVLSESVISHEERLTAFNWMLYCFPVCFLSMVLGWGFLYSVYLRE
ncbi:conserved hypothetical protein [Ixodes scapularis]|uniref:Uncharacterized protein n=1 Tax=Ixodes scapularis TaxID=6945 RepID=B7PYH4_IXOSC|nr:conserved hypothetical protein [Ixodes scapularis]|eukprot:XP_002403112.1 conserved hypothetical protein [Ixodes scapularis]